MIGQWHCNMRQPSLCCLGTCWSTSICFKKCCESKCYWVIDLRDRLCFFFKKHLFNTIKLFKNIRQLKPFETSKCVGGILYFLPLKSALVHRFKRYLGHQDCREVQQEDVSNGSLKLRGCPWFVCWVKVSSGCGKPIVFPITSPRTS